jgi:hypothetical protein
MNLQTATTKDVLRGKLKRECFDSVLFLQSGEETPIDTKTYPYLYNDKGHSVHLTGPRGKLITVAEEVPSLSRGVRYGEVKSQPKTIPTSSGSYVITEFDFGADRVVYEPLWATKETAQAFGITLVSSGESIEFVHEGLVTCQYVYGAYSAFQSPYIGVARRRELLTVNATDLEYHAFAHVFCSQDTLPLVISVARYRAEKREIWLADLWVKPGDCLYIPPKRFSQQYVDLHGNRNSAHACWGVNGKTTLTTETTLGNVDVFAAGDTKPHYHEEKTATVHSFPPGFP